MARFEIELPGEGEYTEKKSRFIGMIKKADTAEAAQEIIDAAKRKYYDARHNCSAYIVIDEEGDTTSRSSDDGEPSGTAGKPILEVMEGSGIVNAVCVVTRYFGGVLLGTGGLVRAYSAAAKAAIEDARLMERFEGIRLSMRCNYDDLGRVEHILRDSGARMIDTSYTEEVVMEYVVPLDAKDALAAKLTEATAARIRPEFTSGTGYAVNGQKQLVLL